MSGGGRPQVNCGERDQSTVGWTCIGFARSAIFYTGYEPAYSKLTCTLEPPRQPRAVGKRQRAQRGGV